MKREPLHYYVVVAGKLRGLVTPSSFDLPEVPPSRGGMEDKNSNGIHFTFSARKWHFFLRNCHFLCSNNTHRHFLCKNNAHTHKRLVPYFLVFFFRLFFGVLRRRSRRSCCNVVDSYGYLVRQTICVYIPFPMGGSSKSKMAFSPT